MKKIGLCLCLVSCIALSVRASDDSRTTQLRRLGVENGLSNSFVSAICQDSAGAIWIATEEGLNRFDGSGVVSYYKADGVLTDSGLNDVLADDARSRIWIATQRAGLCWFDRVSGRFGAYRHDDADDGSLITDDVTHLGRTSDGAVWLSTYHHGLERLDVASGRFAHFNASTVEGMPDAPVYTFCAANDTLLYIGHYHDGFTVLDAARRKAVNFRHDPADDGSLPSDNVNCVYADRFGRIWVGTSRGLALFLPENGRFIRCTGHLSIYAVHLSDDNRLLLGTEMNGAMEIDLQSTAYHDIGEEIRGGVRRPAGLERTGRLSIRCIFEDTYRNLWIGTYGEGVLFVSRSAAGRFGCWRSPVLSEDKTLGLCFDSAGRLWVGTDGGGVNIPGDAALAERCRKALGSDVVLSAYCDSYGNVWLGAYPSGGAVYDRRSGSFRRIDVGDTDLRCFCEVGGRMLIGTSDGICSVDRTTLGIEARYTVDDGLPENLVRTLMVDVRGWLWVGTFGGGLAVFDRQMELLHHYASYTHGGFRSNEINHLYQDRHGYVWVATGEGLVRIDPSDMNDAECFDRSRGLRNDHIRAIAEDSAGNVWFSTNTGISCIDRSGGVLNFDHRDGVTTGNFISNSVARASDGSLCFGSTKGVVHFRPESILAECDLPHVRFTGLHVLDNMPAGSGDDTADPDISRGGPVELSYRQNNFAVSFCVTDFALAGRAEFAYRLGGGEWITTENNKITFMRLAPGSYRLQVRARVRNQAWSDDVEELRITVRPPWYLTWAAKTVCILAALCLAVLVLRRYDSRLKRERELQYERESLNLHRAIDDERLRFYINVTHELRTPLTLILGPLDDLQRDEALPRGPKGKAVIAYRSARQLLILVNELLEFRKTETGKRRLTVCFDDLSQCVEETGLLFSESNTNPDTRLELDIEEGVTAYFDSKAVTTILSNLLSNAMKFTPAGVVTLYLRTVEENGVKYAELGVRDTGCGIPAEALDRIFERYYQVADTSHVTGTGIGLSLAKSMADLHEATIEVESRLGAGSTFRVRLRLDNTYPDAVHSDAVAEDAPSDSGGEENAADNQANDNREIVLVVDDNAAILHYIASSLGDRYDVVTASDGEEGLKIARERMPDIVISDIIMPRVDGFELCRRMKQEVATCHIPVILLTAKDMLMDRTEGYASGADSYITKPFSSTLLESRIRNLLESRRMLARHLVSANRQRQEQAAGTLRPLDNDFLRRLNELIEEQLASEKLNVGYLSKQMCMDSSTLYRKIKGLTGISTNEYIRKVRLHKAAEMLRSGRYNVSEVVWMVGMNSDNYFRQCFREEFGISPSEYRNSEPIG